MRILLTGAHGLLGQKTAIVIAQESAHQLLVTDLAPQSYFRPPRFDYEQLDITIIADVKSLISQYRPDAIINIAAMTDVDGCETDRELCWRINVDGVKNLLVPARKLDGCHFIQISTDYVFDGSTGMYDETSRPDPVSYYGKSKLAAENAIVMSGVSSTLVRTQILYGTGYKVRNNFVSWVLSLLEKKADVPAVTDQVGNPTFVDDLAFALALAAERRAGGIFHISGPEALSRYAFALKIAEVFGFDPKLVVPVVSADLGQMAHRPADSSFVTVRFEAAFGYRCSSPLEGLRKMYHQYRHGAQHLENLLSMKF